MIEVENITYSYGDGTRALDRVSVTFPEEHIFAVTGMSGSGKTTLLNCLARFLRPQSGAIRLNGREIGEMSETAFRAGVGVVFSTNRFSCSPFTTSSLLIVRKRTRFAVT